MTRWDELDRPWQRAFELAWEAYARGTTPVGAVVADESGRIVAEGRNARYDRDAPLAGSHIAHAEIGALAGLSSERNYPDHVLVTTLEPCLLCAGAAVMSNVGTVRFAGVDPYGGASALPAGLNAHLRRGLTRFEGPREDALGLVAAALHVEFYLRRKRNGHVVAAYREATPDLLGAGEALNAARLHTAAAGGQDAATGFTRAIAAMRD
jgi:tRNA(adenine34) deaminase